MLVLDTDHLTDLEWAIHKSEGSKLQARLAVCGNDVATTIISFEEQMRGWMASINRKKLLKDQIEAYRRLHQHLRNYCKYRILDFDEPAAARFHEIRKMKLRVGTMDLKIAAIALSKDATLLSGNVRDFKHVPGLSFEDWRN